MSISAPSTPPSGPLLRGMSPTLVTVLLALFLGMQPLSTDLYLPALPLITQQLQASVAQTQLTFTLMLLGFGFSQLVWGPMSDRWGRRPILLTGFGLYTLASLIATLAPSMGWLVAGRALQGIALGAIVMAGRAVVRDLYSPAAGAQAMSRALTGLGIIACSSPVLGSLLATHWGWQATMAVLGLFSLVLGLLVLLRFQESNPNLHPQATQLRPLLNIWRSIVRHPTFWAYTATTTCSYAGLVAFLTGASFTFMQVLGWTPAQVGWLLSFNGMCYITGTWVCRRLLLRWGPQRTVAFAGGLALLSATSWIACAYAQVQIGWVYAVPVLLYSLGHGMQQPCGQSGSVSPFPRTAGTAVALNSVCMTLGSFAVGQWLGSHFNGTLEPLVLSISVCCVGVALASWTLVRRWGAPPAA